MNQEFQEVQANMDMSVDNNILPEMADELLVEQTNVDEADIIYTDHGRINPEDINLLVKCEIGQISISLEQLTKFKEGDTVELIRWPNKVKLSANGAYFAEGVLVEVEGMLGVKITRKL